MNSNTKIRLVLLFYILLVVVVSLLPSSGEASTWPIDKVGHFVAYAGMAILALLSFDTWTDRLAALVGAIGLGALLEWGQSFIPGRDMSWVDGIANASGVAVGAVFFGFYGRALRDWARSRFRGTIIHLI